MLDLVVYRIQPCGQPIDWATAELSLHGVTVGGVKPLSMTAVRLTNRTVA